MDSVLPCGQTQCVLDFSGRLPRDAARPVPTVAGKDARARGGDTSSRASEWQWLQPCVTAVK